MIERKCRTGLLVLCCMLSHFGSAYAQDHHFAYVQNANGVASAASATSGKMATAKKVYEALVTARGDLRLPVPDFVMNKGEQFVAWMDPVNTVIGMEEKAFDACMQLGPDSLNALAALLSHELTHYYEKHDWSRNFVKGNQGLNSTTEIGNLDEGVKQETQADYLGGFLALTAGYNVYGITARLLPQLYKTYGLPEQLKGYPSLADRVAMSHNAAGQLKELQTVFETAQYLSLLEEFETASKYYRYIKKDYPGREIINNAGVNQALAAMNLFSPKEMPWVLPLEPDPNSRLYALKGIEQDRIQKRTRLLKEALLDFDQALLLDPGYAPAYLNKACCFTLLDNWDDATYWLSKYKAIPGASPAAALVVQGVMAARQENNALAEILFGQARDQGSAIANINLHTLQQDAAVPPRKMGAAAIETINGVYLDDFLEAPEVDKEIKPAPNTTCGIKQALTSKILLHCADNSEHYAVIQLCTAGCGDATQKGIKIGSTAAQVEETYGPPIRRVAWKAGYAYTYSHLNLLFEFNDTGTVLAWGCFRQSQD